MNILTIVGARPQFVKAAVVSKAMQNSTELQESIVHTGQHFDKAMSDVFFEEMGIPKPDHNLGIGGGTHGQNTGRMLEAIEEILLDKKPDGLLIYGDTDSTLAGALAACKLHIPVAHVEAGLRSRNRKMPEELNRILADQVSEVLFAPTETAVTNLMGEGISRNKIHLVGDVMYDATLYYEKVAERSSNVLETYELLPNSYVLATIHRQENTDSRERLEAIFKGMSQSKLPVLLPLHPRTRKALQRYDIPVGPGIRLLEPQGYLDMLTLEKNADMILTDSGGVQKEAYFLGRPCITAREETEWTELVECGANRLVGANPDLMAEALQSPWEVPANQLYGRGDAAEKIVTCLARLS